MPKPQPGSLSFVYHIFYDSYTRKEFKTDPDAVMDSFRLTSEEREAIHDAHKGDFDKINNLIIKKIKDEFERIPPPGWI
ncbi:hypothetical protein H8E77_18650 [bacterium]|nr:hypothetical protein [bacterium]